MIKVSTYQMKYSASRITSQAFDLVRQERIRLNIPFDSYNDPQELGIIGLSASILTSKKGHIKAKQTSINPNWAAAFIDMFKEAHLQSGDHVAAGMTGSFPALNIAFQIAAEHYGLQTTVVSSVTASSFGANIPGLTWLEIEGLLYRNGLIHHRSSAASIGAKDDRGIDLSKEGLDLAKEIIRREKIMPLKGNKKSELIQARIDLFQDANSLPVKAYINIGGGVASVGSDKIKNSFEPGVTTSDELEEINFNKLPEKELDLGVMTFFKSENIPVINIVNIEKLAHKYELEQTPFLKPTIGQGSLYYSPFYFGPVIIGAIFFIFSLLLWQVRKSKKLLTAEEKNPTFN
jgi:poly-gamma-glutamate system protein